MTDRNHKTDISKAVNKCKRFYRKRYIHTLLLLLLFEIVLIYSFLNTYKNEGWEKYLVSLTFLAFIFWTVKLTKRFTKTFSTSEDNTYQGILVQKSRYSQKRLVRQSAPNAYYLLVQVGDKIMEGECMYSTYRASKAGDEIYLFTMGTKELYAVNIEPLQTNKKEHF